VSSSSASFASQFTSGTGTTWDDVGSVQAGAGRVVAGTGDACSGRRGSDAVLHETPFFGSLSKAREMREDLSGSAD
jgi:hypothetical protein